jgi:hypothetical protein
MITEEFIDFWPNFPNDNFFRSYISEHITEHHNHPLCEVHLRFFSVFGKHRRINSLISNLGLKTKMRRTTRPQKTINIWYSGENLNPPRGFDFTLSFKKQHENNYYWPLWVIYTKFGKMKFQTDREFEFNQSKLLSPRNLNTEDRIRKACVFLSSRNDLRYTICRQLEKINLVDIYGDSVGRKVKSKIEVSSRYIFQICFENSDDDFYISEKIFEAWSSGNIPIYLHKKELPYINRKALLETNEKSVAKISDLIIGCNNVDEIVSQPILSEAFELTHFSRALLNLIEEKCGR